MPPLASCMQHVALGEAQALAAFRAEERKSSPAVVASLHAGTAELFEKGAKILRDYTGRVCPANTASCVSAVVLDGSGG